MEKGVRFIIVLALTLTLGACAQPPIPKDSGVSVIDYPDGTKEVNYGPGQYEDAKAQVNIESCQEWAREEQFKKFEQMSTIPESHKSFVLMHWETMAMVKEIFGKGNDPCKPGTNQWDAYIAYVLQHNETIRSVTRSTVELGKSAVITGGMSYAFGQIVDKVGDSVDGDQINAGNNANKAGGDVNQSGAVMPLTRTDMNTKSNITQTQVGSDESTINSAEVGNSDNRREALEEEIEGSEEATEAAQDATET